MIRFLYIFSFVLIVGCQSNSTKEKIDKPIDSLSTLETSETTIVSEQIDTTANFELEESHNEEDAIVNDYLTEELKPIRENFKRINSITNWTLIDKKELWETTEGGEVHFYYTNDKLEKIIARNFGEMFQKLTEYYLLDNELSFVFEKSFKYNRPIDWDSTKMKEMGDNEVLDFEKSEIIEDRSYFIDGKLVHQANNQDCGSPMADDYLAKEQTRLINMYKELIKNK